MRRHVARMVVLVAGLVMLCVSEGAAQVPGPPQCFFVAHDLPVGALQMEGAVPCGMDERPHLVVANGENRDRLLASGDYLPLMGEGGALEMASGVLLAVNLDYFEKKRTKPPETLEELDALLGGMARAGETAILVSNKPAGGNLDRLRLVLTDYMLAQAGNRCDMANWNGGVAKAAVIVKQWYRQGCFADELFWTDGQDALQAFAGGEAPILVLSSWEARQLAAMETPFEPDFMPLPAPAAQAALSTDLQKYHCLVRADLKGQTKAALQALVQEEIRRQRAALPQVQAALEQSLLPGRPPATPETKAHKWQLFLEFLTSSMTADTFEQTLCRLLEKA